MIELSDNARKFYANCCLDGFPFKAWVSINSDTDDYRAMTELSDLGFIVVETCKVRNIAGELRATLYHLHFVKPLP